MNFRHGSLLVFAFLLPLGGAEGAVTLLTFENPPFEGSQDAYGPGQLYRDQGFVFSTPVQNASSIIRFAPGQSLSVPDNGTVHFGGTFGSKPTFAADGDAPFAFFSIDLAYYAQGVTVDSVTVLGTYLEGGTVSEVFSIGEAFQTFQLPQTWTDLVKVELLANFMAWDNVTVAIVPEPAVAGLLLSGLAVIFRRRRPARDPALAE